MKPFASIAANRFGLGARPGEIAAAKSDPKGWLLDHLKVTELGAGPIGSADALRRLGEFRQTKQTGRKTVANKKAARRELAKAFANQCGDALAKSITSNKSFVWRLLDFFSNHFSVSARGAPMLILAPTLEREAIAPNILNKFEDMLLAVTQHPAMLLYLNNERSFGPDSRIGQRQKNTGLNENLAREILELHTLGINGGYEQTDVVELAKAITGWSISRPRDPKPLGFYFRANGHQPGDRQVMGKRYSESGVAQGKAILRDLARHPSTAKFVSYKLARHFVSDHPHEGLVERMRMRWMQSNGDLKAVISTMINSDDAWLSEREKFKTPREFVVSACRASGISQWPQKALLKSLEALGQRPFNAGSPAGYSDTASEWDGADALLARIDWAAQFGYRVRIDALAMADDALGASLTTATRTAISRAESREQGLALLLMSPEFQRR